MPTHLFIFRAEVVDPDGGICEDQRARARRRGVFLNLGMVPPREANRRALSRSISAFSASRIKAVFSATPVNSRAMRRRSSSSAIVVLIGNAGFDYSIR